MNRLLFYFDDTLFGDINKFAKNRHLEETLKSEASSPTADTFTFSINWKLFQNFITSKVAGSPADYLKVGKTRIVFETDGYVRFAGFLASRPARSGLGATQELALTFYEYFARLSGDLVCDASNPTDPYVRFEEPAHLYVKDLIDLFIAHATAAGENINWDYGTVIPLANKNKTYKDFQTIAKALCDAMNNVSGAGKFDVVFRTDPTDYTHQLIDILKPRGQKKNIIIRYPADGIYKLWASDYSVEETNDYASHVIVAGNGQVGNVDEGEQTAAIGTAEDGNFVREYCYWRQYITRSDLESQNAVDAAAQTELDNRAFNKETPNIQLVGRPIEWGNAANLNNGLALGDIFFFSENTNDLDDNSGWYRIIGLITDWDDNGVQTVVPKLLPAPEES